MSANAKFRLLGVSLSKFEKDGDGEEWLFPEMGDPKKEALYKSVDEIKRKYGFHKLEKAASLDPEGDGPRPKGPSPFRSQKPDSFFNPVPARPVKIVSAFIRKKRNMIHWPFRSFSWSPGASFFFCGFWRL